MNPNYHDRNSAQFYADILGAHHQGKTGTTGERENRAWNALQDELSIRCGFIFYILGYYRFRTWENITEELWALFCWEL